MGKLSRWTALAVIAVGSALAAPAGADKLLFSGTHAIKFSHNGVLKEVSATGTGVAVVNGGAGGTTLNTIVLTRPFAKIDATELATTPGIGIDEIRFENVRINPLLAGPNKIPGEFAPILAAAKGTMVTAPLTRSTLPAAGTIRLCLLADCKGLEVPLKLTQTNNSVAIGPGVGGNFTAMGMSGTAVTVKGKPWTVNTTAVMYINKTGNTATFSLAGTVHGPDEMTGTTLNTVMGPGMTSMGMSTVMGGTLQLVSGIQTTCAGCGDSNDESGQITRLTLNFAPEPSLLALFTAGATAVALLGLARARRH
jgi:hypothetical protein